MANQIPNLLLLHIQYYENEMKEYGKYGKDDIEMGCGGSQ